METTSDVTTTETPDRGANTKHWSPRRFEYGGRKFVWKGQNDGGAFKKFGWEDLHEYTRAWPAEGSRTGKMEDETVGERLAWAEKSGMKGVEFNFYFHGGLDQHFREHLLASMLARHIRQVYPAAKDNTGVEAAGATSSAFGFITAVTGV